MLDRNIIFEVLADYDLTRAKIGVIGSHSALDVCDGAVEEGIKTFVVCQKGRERTYTHYFKRTHEKGIVDETLVLDKFSDIMAQQHILFENNVLLIPNRSFTSYVDIERIEDEFKVPLIGSRNLLRSEERGGERDYYWLLERTDMPFPERMDAPEDIKELCIVKLKHAVKKLERGFFSASSYKEYQDKAARLLSQNVITQEDLDGARIERYIIGPVFNLDMFYSPLDDALELLGIDWRFETSLDGHVRLPAPQQLALSDDQMSPEYTVCGHNAATLRESLLEKAFALGERYVEATKRYYKPGVIGPFCLQTCVDKDLNFYIYDIAPRVGGGTNVHMSVGHPYGNTLWRRPMSTGRRTVFEVKRAIESDRVRELVT